MYIDIHDQEWQVWEIWGGLNLIFFLFFFRQFIIEAFLPQWVSSWTSQQ